jgi:hypothetical protein
MDTNDTLELYRFSLAFIEQYSQSRLFACSRVRLNNAAFSRLINRLIGAREGLGSLIAVPHITGVLDRFFHRVFAAQIKDPLAGGISKRFFCR